jgi:hypothetical protein
MNDDAPTSPTLSRASSMLEVKKVHLKPLSRLDHDSSGG